MRAKLETSEKGRAGGEDKERGGRKRDAETDRERERERETKRGRQSGKGCSTLRGVVGCRKMRVCERRDIMMSEYFGTDTMPGLSLFVYIYIYIYILYILKICITGT